MASQFTITNCRNTFIFLILVAKKPPTKTTPPFHCTCVSILWTQHSSGICNMNTFSLLFHCLFGVCKLDSLFTVDELQIKWKGRQKGKREYLHIIFEIYGSVFLIGRTQLLSYSRHCLAKLELFKCYLLVAIKWNYNTWSQKVKVISWDSKVCHFSKTSEKKQHRMTGLATN